MCRGLYVIVIGFIFIEILKGKGLEIFVWLVGVDSVVELMEWSWKVGRRKSGGMKWFERGNEMSWIMFNVCSEWSIFVYDGVIFLFNYEVIWIFFGIDFCCGLLCS